MQVKKGSFYRTTKIIGEEENFIVEPHTGYIYTGAPSGVVYGAYRQSAEGAFDHSCWCVVELSSGLMVSRPSDAPRTKNQIVDYILSVDHRVNCVVSLDSFKNSQTSFKNAVEALGGDDNV